VTRRKTFGEDRVMYFDAKGKLCSILASWTSLAEPDLFAKTAAGRSWFRVDDLVRRTDCRTQGTEEEVAR
jgi:hypothetical protein